MAAVSVKMKQELTRKSNLFVWWFQILQYRSKHPLQ